MKLLVKKDTSKKALFTAINKSSLKQVKGGRIIAVIEDVQA